MNNPLRILIGLSLKNHILFKALEYQSQIIMFSKKFKQSWDLIPTVERYFNNFQNTNSWSIFFLIQKVF